MNNNIYSQLKITLLLLFIFNVSFCFSENKINYKKSRDYPILMLGPEIAGSIALSMNSEDELLAKLHYSAGGFIKVRPVRFMGLESGFKFHNIVNTQKFYEIPISFYFFGRNNQAFIIGPNLLYKIENGNSNFQKPKVGFTIGGGNQYVAIKFNFYPSYINSFMEDDIQFYLGIGLNFQLSIFAL